MHVFVHHLYEYKKGLRNLILHTTKAEYKNAIVAKLLKNDINYLIQHVGEKKINVFFGAEACIRVVEHFIDKSLSDLTDEEDFILGTMLGYDGIIQCNRYIQRKEKQRVKKVAI